MWVPQAGLSFSGRQFVCLMGFLILLGNHVISQDQELADSLEAIYVEGNFAPEEELQILKDLAAYHTDTEVMLRYSEKLIQLAEAAGENDFLVAGFLQSGHAHRMRGDLSKALENYFRVAILATGSGSLKDRALARVAIADVYSVKGEHDRSVKNYREGIRIFRKINDSVGLASAVLNLGDEFFNAGELDSALQQFQESGQLFQALDHEIGLAYNLGNSGMVYAQQGQLERAETYISQSVEMLEQLGDYYPISVYLTYMSDIYQERGRPEDALAFARKSLRLAETYGLKEQIRDAHLKLSELHEYKGDADYALLHYKDYVRFRDSVVNLEAVQKMADMRADSEIAQKQVEVDLLRAKDRIQRLMTISAGAALLLIGLLAVGLFRRNRYIRKTSAIISEEKKRSDHLLQNILPEETAEELKTYGKVQARNFESVTVMFADFNDFTTLAKKMTPEKLVESVDFYFSAFDRIMEKHDLEKIKTLGDAYMAAGGLPFPTEDHAERMVQAALEMIAFVEKVKAEASGAESPFEIRVGINSGPVIAGVVGFKKFAYDIWGDTVNIASRMESSSAIGQVNVSENTYLLIKDKFDCSYRGEVMVKHQGNMRMYFVQEER